MWGRRKEASRKGKVISFFRRSGVYQVESLPKFMFLPHTLSLRFLLPDLVWREAQTLGPAQLGLLSESTPTEPPNRLVVHEGMGG